MKQDNKNAEDVSHAPIGVFDSGVGGLTVTQEIMKNLPNERIVYFGDTARVPYGSKSKETIIKYSKQVIKFLRTQNVKAIVVACNTATAFALEELEADLDIPIIGVIKPGAALSVKTTVNKRIGVIGTEGTILSQVYNTYIHNIDSGIQIIEKACPLFVPLVEEGFIDDSVTKEIAKRYLKDLQLSRIDTLILGCTHYPLLRNMIGEIMGPEITLINPAYETAQSLERLLKREGIDNKEERIDMEEPYRFFVSDTADKFKQFANSILPYDIEKIMKINIEEY
jgi:glutamate racemase